MIGKRAKAILKTLLGEQLLGVIDYFRHPKMRSAWGGPFNGQLARVALFESLVAKLKPRVIIETGTFRGTTTECMARTGLPIFTVESQLRNYGFARARLFRLRNVAIRYGDSRAFVHELFRGPLRGNHDQVILAYLDAHGEGDLPLAEEINLIFEYRPAAVVVIDDFQVPFDSGYRYDIYRSGEALTHSYIESQISRHDLQAFYPSVPALQETGSRRGCVVLAKKTRHLTVLASMPELRRFDG